MGKSVWWIAPGMISLALFAFLLTLAPSNAARRTYTAYGGIYIAASILRVWLIEGHRPDRWDLTGAAVCLIGTAIILFPTRS